jgi:hypothetical protein
MGRLCRAIDDGLVYHALNRGNNRGCPPSAAGWAGGRSETERGGIVTGPADAFED